MAQNPTRLFAGNLTAVLGTVLATAAAGKTVIVKQITLCNASTSAATVSMGFAGFNLLAGLSLAPNSTTTIDLSQILNAGETITGGYVTLVNNSVAVLISGVVSP